LGTFSNQAGEHSKVGCTKY